MDLNENDLLYTNEFIKTPELEGEVPVQFNDEFKKYYKSELEKQKAEQLRKNVEKISLVDMSFSEETDPTNIENTNKFLQNASSNMATNVSRIQREFKTYVNIDSRDRDRLKYPNPNTFKIFLGKTFYNVSMIRLASLEFPNSNNVINDSNNKIYWRNKYDIDNGIIDKYTDTYPIYELQLDNGNYTLNSLRTQINTKSGKIERDGTTYLSPEFHNLVLDVIIASNESSLTSIKYVSLGSNPLKYEGPFTLSIDFTNYKLLRIPKIGDNIHLIGAQLSDGGRSDFLNGIFTITNVTNTTKIFFNVSSIIPANQSGQSFGGPSVFYGVENPFQLTFGDKKNTINDILGFPPQNSADPIITNLEIESISVTSGSVGVTGTTVGTLVITTKEEHNFTLNDIENTIKIYDAPYIPSLEKENKIVNVLSDKQFVIEGNVDFIYDRLTYNHKYKGPGFFYTYNPIKTICPQIKECIYTNSTRILEITTYTRHYLNQNDSVRINNIITVPNIVNNNIFVVLNPEEDTTSGVFKFRIMLPSDIDGNNINISNATVGTSLLELTCQNHGLNEIVGFSIDGSNNLIINLKFNDNLNVTPSRISQSAGWITDPTIILYGTGLTYPSGSGNQTINLDGKPFGLDANLEDVGGSRLPVEPTGISITLPVPVTIEQVNNLNRAENLGNVKYRTKDYSFYLYNVKTDTLVDNGITDGNINNTKFEVRELLDQHRFVFKLDNYYASSVEKFGGDIVFISSTLKGFKGVQTNKLFDKVYRKIALNGENYVFLQCPQLATMLNTGNVQDIFARILLDQFPGSMVFSFLSNPKVFTDAPLNKLEELDFSIVQYNNQLYNFNDLDYSFVLEITEVQDTIENANFSSRRGVSAVNSNPYIAQGQLGYTPQPNAQSIEPPLPKPGDF